MNCNPPVSAVAALPTVLYSYIERLLRKGFTKGSGGKKAVKIFKIGYD